MESVDLNKIKQEAVHTGLLEAIVHLHQAYNKINASIKDEELNGYSKHLRILGNMSDTLCDFTADISEMIGLLFAVKSDESITKQLKNSQKK